MAKRDQERQVKAAMKGKKGNNPNSKRIDEEQKLEDEIIQGYNDRQNKL